MKKHLIFYPLLCLVTTLGAQSPGADPKVGESPNKPELPSSPLMQAAGSFSQWQVIFSYADEQNDKSSTSKLIATVAGARPRKTLTTKTGAVVHEQTVDMLKRETDIWFNNGTQHTKTGTDPVWYQADPGHVSQSYSGLPANGFRQLDWITEANYAGTVPYGTNRKCLVFTPGGYQKLDLVNPTQREQRIAAAVSVAYIDDETRLPVVVRVRNETRTYHFDPPPTEMQTLPDDLANQVKKAEEAHSRLYQAPPRPY